MEEGVRKGVILWASAPRIQLQCSEPFFSDIEIFFYHVIFIPGDRSDLLNILEELTRQGCGIGRDGCSAPDGASLGLWYNLWPLKSAATTWGACSILGGSHCKKSWNGHGTAMRPNASKPRSWANTFSQTPGWMNQQRIGATLRLWPEVKPIHLLYSDLAKLIKFWMPGWMGYQRIFSWIYCNGIPGDFGGQELEKQQFRNIHGAVFPR